MLVKIINVVAGIKLNRTDSYLLLLIIHILNVLRKLSVSVFTVSLSYENILSQNSQSTCSSLYRKGLNSAWSWNFSQNLTNGWVLINKRSKNSSLNKSSVCIHLKVVHENCKLFYITNFDFYRLCNSHVIQQLVLDDDCCISQNIGGTEINLVKSNDLYFS